MNEKQTASKRFHDTLDRCKALMETVGEYCENEGVLQDVLRYVVVLAVSGFDMYIADSFAENFVQYIKGNKLGNKDEDFLTEMGLNVLTTIEIMKASKKRPFRGLRGLLDSYLAHKPMQSVNKINELYRFYGLPSFMDSVLGGSKKKQASGKQARSTKLRKDFTDMVSRRHEIVHNADYDGRYNLQQLSCEQVEKWLVSIGKIVVKCDGLLSKRFSKKH